MLLPGLAQAVSYAFPGNLPVGCSGSAGSYTCGHVVLLAGDTISVGAAGTTISFSSLNTNNNARINDAGTAGLTLNVAGTLAVGSGTVVKATVNAVYVSNPLGSATFVGNLNTTTSGAYLGTGTAVTGNISATSFGLVTLLGSNTVQGSISTQGGYVLIYADGVVNGSITSTTGNIDLRYRVRVTGSLSCACSVILYRWTQVDGDITGTHMNNDDGDSVFGGAITLTTGTLILGDNSVVAGGITSTTGDLYLQTATWVKGAIQCDCSLIAGQSTRVDGGVAVNVVFNAGGPNSTFGGSVKAKVTNIHLGSGSVIKGDAIADKGYVEMASTSTVQQCARSRRGLTTDIYMYSGSTAGGVCCGDGSGGCTNSCVFRAVGVSMPPTCSSAASSVAEYRFEQTAYTGAAGEVLDSSLNRRHGTMLGGVGSTASGKVCRGAVVPRNTTTAIQALSTNIDVNSIGNTGSIAFWYKSVSSGTEHRMLFDATTSSGGRFYLYRDDAGSGVDLNFHLTDGGGTDRNVDKLNALTDGQWGHVVVTWRFKAGTLASRMRLYVNGVQQDEQSFSVSSGAINAAIGTLHFGDNRSDASLEINSANGSYDQVRIFDGELTASEVSAVYAEAPGCAPSVPHHIEVATDRNRGVTCKAENVTVRACADAACSAPFLGGVSGSLTFTGGTVVSPAAFNIPAGSDSASVSMQLTTPGSTTVGLAGLSSTPTAGAAPYCGFGVTPALGGSCVYSADESGFVFDVPNHVAGDSQSVVISAVRKSDNALSCTAALTGAGKSVNFRCSHVNPTSGFVPVVVGGAALNAANNAAAACDGTGRNITLSFDASGQATTTVSTADVGQLSLQASYSGSGADAGLSLTGSDAFIAAPAGLRFVGVSPRPLRAGASFSATVEAFNRAGNLAANFGREVSPAGASLTWFKREPTGPGSVSGVFTGSLGAFSGGRATAGNLAWSEVGTADLQASHANYLGSGIDAQGITGSGPTGAVGPFTPDHFTLEVAQACTGSSPFTYSGQPFALTLTARNAAGQPTQNHDGTLQTAPNFAKPVTLSAVTNASTGTLRTTSLSAAAFAAGVATVSDQAFTYTNKLTPPAEVTLRAVDIDGVTSQGHTEQGPSVRSGRLKLSNAFGSERSSLRVPVQAQHWSGRDWVLNGADGCTTVPAASIVKARYLDHRGAATSAWTTSVVSDVALSNGQGAIELTAPTSGGTGTLDLALNLGSGSTDQSCLSVHPASTGANRDWLRARNGNCSSADDRDPSARATFGVFTPETRKLIHVQDVF